jgi:hypothetical protein
MRVWTLRVGVTWTTSPNRPVNKWQLLRRNNGMLNLGHFAGSGVWHVPGRPTVWSLGAPRNATQCDKANSEAGRKFFSRGPMDTARVTVTFPKSQTPFVLQDQNPKERKNA